MYCVVVLDIENTYFNTSNIVSSFLFINSTLFYYPCDQGKLYKNIWR